MAKEYYIAPLMLRTVAHKIARLPGFCLVARRLRAWRSRQLFRREFDQFKSDSTNSKVRFPIRWEDRRAFFSDRVGTSAFDRHYFFHQAWAARVLAETKPVYHVDISSHVDFSAIVSAFIPVKFYDFHPVRAEISNLQTGRADLTHLQFQDNSIPCIVLPPCNRAYWPWQVWGQIGFQRRLGCTARTGACIGARRTTPACASRRTTTGRVQCSSHLFL